MKTSQLVLLSILGFALPASAAHPEAAGVGQAILKLPGCFKWGATADSEVISLPGEKNLRFLEDIGLARKVREIRAADYLKEARPHRYQGAGEIPPGQIHVFALTDEGKQLFSRERKSICHRIVHATRVTGWVEPKEGPDGLIHTYITYEWRIEDLKPEWKEARARHFKEVAEKGLRTIRLVKKNGQWVEAP